MEIPNLTTDQSIAIEGYTTQLEASNEIDLNSETPVLRDVSPFQAFMMTQATIGAALAAGLWKLVTVNIGQAPYEVWVEYDDAKKDHLKAMEFPKGVTAPDDSYIPPDYSIYHKTVLVLKHANYYRSVLYRGADNVFRFVKKLTDIPHEKYNREADKGFLNRPKS